MNKIICIIVKMVFFVAIIEISNKLYFKKIVGVVALKRDNVTVVTTISVIALIRYLMKGKKKEFEKDCVIFFNSLKKGLYFTETHSVIKNTIEKKCGKENVLIIEVKKRRMLLSKLLIGNTDKLFKKYRYFRVNASRIK